MRKITKKIFSLVMVIAMLSSYIISIVTVFALDTFQVILTISVANSSDVTLAARNGDGPLGNNVVGDGLVAYRGGNQYIIGFDDTSTNTGFPNSSVSVSCSSDKTCTATITVPNEHGVKTVVGGGTPFKFMVGGNNYNDAPLASGTTVEIVNDDNQQVPFDGKAYLIWSCGSGMCYHLFEGLSNETSFVKASTITADNNGDQTFDVHAESKGFALKSDFEDWLERYKQINNLQSINWTTLDADAALLPIDKGQYEDEAVQNHNCNPSDPEDTFHGCVDDYVDSVLHLLGGVGLQPVGEPYSNNAYTSYGDRRFKITIYNDDYRGVTLGSLTGLSYYPSVWTDGLSRIESYDVSGTSEDHPVDIDTVLLESTINIKELAYNSFQITGIEALNVPDDAVTITKTNGEYKIKFNSNFYDKVVFKVTSANSPTSYFRINRLTLSVSDEIRFRGGQNSVDLVTDFYFDRTTSYQDYILTAKVEYKDGTNKIVELENTKEIDDGLGNKTYYFEVDEENPPYGSPGKGLKKANYKHTFTTNEAKKISKVYLNVEYTGSTSTTYAGAFAGSGKGVAVNFVEED